MVCNITDGFCRGEGEESNIEVLAEGDVATITFANGETVQLQRCEPASSPVPLAFGPLHRLEAGETDHPEAG
jgi:hypothetical protein